MNLLVIKEDVGKQFDYCIRNQEVKNIYKIQSINLNLSTSSTESVVRLQNKGWCREWCEVIFFHFLNIYSDYFTVFSGKAIHITVNHNIRSSLQHPEEPDDFYLQ